MRTLKIFFLQETEKLKKEIDKDRIALIKVYSIAYGWLGGAKPI